jgi:hypothetical protein
MIKKIPSYFKTSRIKIGLILLIMFIVIYNSNRSIWLNSEGFKGEWSKKRKRFPKNVHRPQSIVHGLVILQTAVDYGP